MSADQDRVVATDQSTQMLSGWKAIAGFIRRDERTAMRWAAERGLPVRRVPGGKRGPVYAIPAEISSWMERRRDEQPDGRIRDGATGTGTAAHPISEVEDDVPPLPSAHPTTATAPERAGDPAPVRARRRRSRTAALLAAALAGAGAAALGGAVVGAYAAPASFCPETGITRR